MGLFRTPNTSVCWTIWVWDHIATRKSAPVTIEKVNDLMTFLTRTWNNLLVLKNEMIDRNCPWCDQIASWVTKWQLNAASSSQLTILCPIESHGHPRHLCHATFADFEMISTTTGSWIRSRRSRLRRGRIQLPVVVEIISKSAKVAWQRWRGCPHSRWDTVYVTATIVIVVSNDFQLLPSASAG